MHFVLALTMLLVVDFAGTVRADFPATQPDVVPLSPKDTMLDWVDHLPSMSVDDLLRTYAYSGDNQKALAQVIAEQVVAIAKLQKAVDVKWGKDSEATVLHACSTDTREDDEQAKETINGDHAVITFKLDSISPLPLIRVDGQWKLDIAAYVSQVGDHLNDVEASTRQITAIVNSATTAVAGDKYSDAAHLAQDIESQIEKAR
jgi:hypothetical protein